MKKLLILVMSVFILIILTSCDRTSSYADKEEELVGKNQSTLLTNQPPVSLKWSLERENINKRTNRWNDVNKISYIYLITDYGQIMAFYTIKGKVSSVNSQITNPEKVVENGATGIATLPSPAEDGSYGSNGDAIFFFTTDDAYVEWNGKYLLCDKPLKLSTAPLLVREMEK